MPLPKMRPSQGSSGKGRSSQIHWAEHLVKLKHLLHLLGKLGIEDAHDAGHLCPLLPQQAKNSQSRTPQTADNDLGSLQRGQFPRR